VRPLNQAEAAIGATARRAMAAIRGLRQAAARESPRRRRLWIAAAAMLVLGPLAFNVARAGELSASVELFPRQVGTRPAVTDPGFWRGFLTDPELRLQMLLNARARPAEYADARIEPAGPGPSPLSVGVPTPTPRRSRELTNALAPQLVGASGRLVTAGLRRDLAETQQRVADARRGTDEHQRLVRRIIRIRRLMQAPQGAVLGLPATEPEPTRLADKIADAMPGDFPARPSPVWSALAGLLLATTLWAVGLVLVPPPPRR
jgi:hypothetical protein